MTAATPDETSLAKRVSELEGKLKKYTLVGAIAGVLLGGGGVLGAAQWIYKAPLEKRIMAYESAVGSIQNAIQMAQDDGDQHTVTHLHAELIALDRNHRRALGLVAECMELMAQGKTEPFWFKRVANQMRELQQEQERRSIEQPRLDGDPVEEEREPENANNNPLHAEPRVAQFVKSMSFAAAR